jgi:hypothetical protein
VVNIFEWVLNHLTIVEPFVLASPALATKDRKLGQGGTVRSADLMPSILLNFSWADRDTARAKQLCLSEEALSLIQRDDGSM